MRMWDDRYDTEEYVYGKEPNDFIVAAFKDVPPGRILALAAGEGRNEVYLARQGHEVIAVDSSAVGLKKARALARELGVTIHTIHADLTGFDIEPEEFDAITSFFWHPPAPLRTRVYRAVVRGLRPGGRFVMEAYTPRQMEYATGGPKEPALLVELADVKQDLAGLEFGHAIELVREFKEGKTHQGRGSVVQIIALKPPRI